MARSGSMHLAVAAMVALGLAGCENGATGADDPATGEAAAETAAGETTAAAATPARATRATRLVDRDVEAPEVFQVTDTGLWDGRPSLGGVWVASPDAADPERVIIRNPENGKFVIGALFRRERDNPGPKLQISSDAAAALGLLAGAPKVVNVTALRREEAPMTAPDAGAPILDAAETVDTEIAADPAPADQTVAIASAAIDAAEAAPADTGEAAAEAPATETKAPWWSKKRREQKAAEAATAETAAAPEAVSTETQAAAPAAAPSPTPAPAPAASGGKSLIQIGIFSVEANAERSAQMVVKGGAPAQVIKDQSQGKPYWRVVAGPATTAADRDALMARIKGLGFQDAYFVSR